MRNVLRNWFAEYFSDEEAVILFFALLISFGVVLILGKMLAPVFTALILAYMAQGLVLTLTKQGLPEKIAVYGVYILGLGLFVMILFMLLPLTWQQLTSLLNDQLPKMIIEGKILLMRLPELYPGLVTVEQAQAWVNLVTQKVGGGGQAILSFSIDRILDAMTALIYLILVPLLVFFFMKDKAVLIHWFGSLLPNKRGVLTQVMAEMDNQLSNYIRGKALEIFIVGVVSFLVFVWLGLNYAVLLALLVGLSVMVPYIGAAVVTVPVAAVGYFQFGWGGVGSDFFILMLLYAIIQALDGNVLVPILFSEAVNLHPVAIIVAILVFGGLWGFWGVFFAIPLATLVKAVLSAWPRSTQHQPVQLLDADGSDVT